jgi:hypothetical protein
MTKTLDFPIVIGSGASQVSIEYYARKLNKQPHEIKLFPEIVAESLAGYCINIATPGISNRKILRKTLYECIKQSENNPGQPIIVLVELTFDLRKDLWIESVEKTEDDKNDSNFVSAQIARNINWWKERFNRNISDTVIDIIEYTKSLTPMDKKYVNQWQKVEQYFYSSYAENINLNMDLINFTGYMKSNNIRYLIFRGNPVEKFEEEHLLDTFNAVLLADPGVFDLRHFSFTQWCLEKNYKPIDSEDRPEIGHPSLEAHRRFGLFLANHFK